MGGERRGWGGAKDAKEEEAAEEAAAVAAATDGGAGYDDRSFMQIGEQGRMGLCVYVRGCPSAIRLGGMRPVERRGRGSREEYGWREGRDLMKKAPWQQ
jgi:hypothetical protein